MYKIQNLLSIILNHSLLNRSQKHNMAARDDDADNDFDNEPDETIGERLWGLTEMFPESLKNFAVRLTGSATQGVKTFVNISRQATWVVLSSAIILATPLYVAENMEAWQEIKTAEREKTLFGYGNAVAAKELPPLPFN